MNIVKIFRASTIRVRRTRAGKAAILAYLITLSCLGQDRAAAQEGPPEPPVVGNLRVPNQPPADPLAQGDLIVPGVTNWVRRENRCCAPSGFSPIVGTELYFRVGPSVPIGDQEVLSRNLQTGVTIQGGARSLFYNDNYTRAWVIDGSISNSFYSGGGTNPPELFTLNVIVPHPIAGANPLARAVPVGVRNYNKTMVNLGAGREWFSRSAQSPGPQWRWGVDGGGGWGSSSMEFDRTLPHRTDVVGRIYVGGHVGYEFPCGHCILNFGVRTEYSYTWCDILQQASDLQEMSFLFNSGIRW